MPEDPPPHSFLSVCVMGDNVIDLFSHENPFAGTNKLTLLLCYSKPGGGLAVITPMTVTAHTGTKHTEDTNVQI